MPSVSILTHAYALPARAIVPKCRGDRQCEDDARTCDLMGSGHPAVVRFPGRAILRHSGGGFRQSVRILFWSLPEPRLAAELADAVRPARRPFRGSGRDRLRLIVV